jgi:hypothetical protein
MKHVQTLWRINPTLSAVDRESWIGEGFKSRVAAYIERIQFRREAPWTRSAHTARVSI